MYENQTRKNIFPDLPFFIEQGKSLVLATVARTFGSVPQKPGSSAVFTPDGLLSGTIGGGLVEFRVGKQAVHAAESKKSGFFTFDLNHKITDKDSLICGGGMEILLDAMPEKHLEVFRAMSDSYSRRIPGILVTKGKTSLSEEMVVERFWITRETAIRPIFRSELTHHTIDEMLQEDHSPDCAFFSGEKVAEEHCTFMMMEKITPLPELIIAGAGHVGRALAHLGKLLEFEVTVWDDRSEYANKINLPNAGRIVTGPLDSSLAGIKVSKNTFIVIVTRGHAQDAEVLRTFIGSDAGYIGMMGSRNKIARIKDQFLQNGWATREQWEKIYTPIGLMIGSETVQEIAISIAAQIIQVKNQLLANNG